MAINPGIFKSLLGAKNGAAKGTGALNALSLLSNVADRPNDQGRTSVFGSTLKTASTGAQLGMQVGGPLGAGIGAGLGAIGGFFMGKDAKYKEEQAETRLQNAQHQAAKDKGAAFAGANPEEIFGNKNAGYFKLGGKFSNYYPDIKTKNKMSLKEISQIPDSRYEPSDAVKRTKGALAAVSFVNYPASIAGSVYDAGTAVKYALDGQWQKAGSDLAQAAIGLVPGTASIKAALRGINSAKKGRVLNNLRVLKAGDDLTTIADGASTFKNGGKIKSVSNGAIIEGPSHEEGGVPLGNAEVEGGETLAQGSDGTYVMSNMGGIAAAHKKMLRAISKIENKPMSPERVNALKRLRNRENLLINFQQSLNGNA